MKLFIIFCLFFVTVTCAVKNKEWWEHATFYQIYPRSFKDSDGDGIGDLKGITSKLNHLKEMGMDALWLSPMFESPQVDFGYDISNFYEVESEYGTMADFEAMITVAKEYGLNFFFNIFFVWNLRLFYFLDIKILLDFVPNHSSNLCEWFQKSREPLVNPDYADYYTWHDGKLNEAGDRVVPNNWISVFGGPAWTFDDTRQQYYLHQFAPEQPDLNYRNEAVVQEMENVMKFWLGKGVDGFRLDAINHMFETESLPDEEVYPDSEGYDSLNHIHTKDLVSFIILGKIGFYMYIKIFFVLTKG